MSRLPATSAENLANELHRQLELVEFERDEAIRERDEAQAVIEQCRKVRDSAEFRQGLWSDFRVPVDRYRVGMHDAYRNVVRSLDRVDGL